MEEVVAGLDIGTSSIKLVFYGGKGVVYSDRKEYSKEYSNGREIDPIKLLADIIDFLRKAIKSNNNVRITAIGISSFFPSLIVLDRMGEPLTKIITWLDSRGDKIAHSYHQRQKAAIILQKKTGCIIHGSYPIWKILWLKRNRMKIFKRAKKYLSLPDYLVFKLTGKYFVSHAIASTTGLLNIHSLKWDNEILEMTGISESQLPECRSIFHSEKFLDKMRLKIGLDIETALVLGAGDGHLSNIGSGCLDSGTMCSTIGTSSALRVIGNPSKINNSVWRYYLYDKKYIYGIASNAGVRTLAWFHKNMFHRSMRSLFSDINRIDLNQSTKIMCLPFIDGDRNPNYGQEMTASISGLNSTNTSNDIYKAIVEGIIYNLFHCYENLVDLNNKPKEIIATGGCVYAEKMLQMQSDVFNMRIRVPYYKECSAVGAAMIALVAIGKNLSLSAIKMKHEKVYFPDKIRHKEHRRKYGLYKERLLKLVGANKVLEIYLKE